MKGGVLILLPREKHRRSVGGNPSLARIAQQDRDCIRADGILGGPADSARRCARYELAQPACSVALASTRPIACPCVTRPATSKRHSDFSHGSLGLAALQRPVWWVASQSRPELGPSSDSRSRHHCHPPLGAANLPVPPRRSECRARFAALFGLPQKAVAWDGPGGIGRVGVETASRIGPLLGCSRWRPGAGGMLQWPGPSPWIGSRLMPHGGNLS